MRLFAIPLVLLAPVAWVWVLARGVHRAPADERSTRWFAFGRRTQLAMTVTWMAWPAALWFGGVNAWLLPMAKTWGVPAYATSLSLALILPPALAGIAIAALVHGVHRAACGAEITQREAVENAVWQHAALVIPVTLVTLAASAAFAYQFRIAAAAALGSLIAAILIGRRKSSAFALAPHAITTGELRDRLFALAKGCRVRIRQLYVVPTARMRLANAFAVRGQVVVLTDYLLEHLSRREIDAVLAHELIHLARNHPARLLMIPALASGVVWFGAREAPGWMVWPAAFAIGSLVLFAVSRGFERAADRGAVLLTKDPEALISALGRISRLNHMPLEWGAWNTRMLTHPSTLQRSLAIAKHGGVHRARVDALLRDGLEDRTRYAIPQAASGAGKVFSTTIKARVATRLTLLGLASFVVAPALMCAVSRWMPPVPRPLFDLWALALAVAVSLAVIDVASVRPYAAIRTALRERLRGRGLDPGREGAVFVGLSPGATLKVYEGCGDWDVGFIGADAARLVFLGEEAHFTLRRDQVTNIRVGDGLPGWLRAPRVVVEWSTDAGEEGVLQFRPGEVSRILQGGEAAEALFERLTAWWLEGTALGSDPEWLGANLGPPPLGEVTGDRPRDLVRAPMLVAQLAVLFLLAAITSALLGLRFDPLRGPGLVDVFAVAALASLFHRLPVWRRREPETIARRAEPDRRAA